MKTRWKILIVLALFLAVFTIIWGLTLHIGPENELEAFKKSLRDKGEKLEISDWIPAPVPPDQNGADFFRSAIGLFAPGGIEPANIPLAMELMAPGKAMIGWVQPDIRDYNRTNSWDDIRTAVEIDRPVIELLRQAAAFPVIDFHLDYNLGFLRPFTNLDELEMSVNKLRAAAIFDLHEQKTAESATNICALLALAGATHQECTEVSQSFRIAFVNWAAEVTWEFLQSTNVSDVELVSLQEAWRKPEFISSMETAYEMQRAFYCDAFIKLRAANPEFQKAWEFDAPSLGWARSGDWMSDAKEVWEDAKDSATLSIWRTSWSYSDEVFALKYDQIALDVLRDLKTKPVFYPSYTNLVQHEAMGVATTNSSFILQELGLLDGRNSLRERFLQPGEFNVRRLMAVEACRQIALTAIALKRFQLAHGHLPGNLSELVPACLEKMPLDPVDGQPLRYRPATDGTFLLYSIGADGVDDGGNPVNAGAGKSLYWQSGRDWVWPQPATPEEIEAYYAAEAAKAK
jgi:hypothetical protein